MRIAILTTLAALATTTLWTDAVAQRRSQVSRSLSQFTYEVVEFDAPSVGGKASYGIYLPKAYQENDAAGDPGSKGKGSDGEKTNGEDGSARRYPLVIWLHGMRGSTRRFRDNGAAILDGLRKAKKIPELILVTPSAGGRATYVDRGKGRNEESLILRDVLGHVEKKWRVARERHRRAIMGVSMGALGALKMALKYPKRFGSVAVHSAPVLSADPKNLGRFRRFATQIFGDPIDEKVWAKEIPIAILAKKQPKDLHGLRIYFDAGSDDRLGFGPTNVSFSKQLKKAGFDHTFRYIDGGGHSWGTNAIQHAMKFSFPFVAKGLRKTATKQPKTGAPGEGKGKEPHPGK